MLPLREAPIDSQKIGLADRERLGCLAVDMVGRVRRPSRYARHWLLVSSENYSHRSAVPDSSPSFAAACRRRADFLVHSSTKASDHPCRSLGHHVRLPFWSGAFDGVDTLLLARS